MTNTHLSSYSLSNLLKPSLVMEFKGLARALWRWYEHTLVKVGRGLQLLPGLLFQLLSKLFSLYRPNVSYTLRSMLVSEQKKNPLSLRLIWTYCTFERGHAMCEFDLFAWSVHCSSFLIQNQRSGLVDLLDLHFSICDKQENNIKHNKYKLFP